MPQGSANGTAVLTEDNVVEIRQRYLSGNFSFGELARKFAVPKSTVQKVLDCANWRWLSTSEEIEQLRLMREERNTNKLRRRK
jgi:predicted DNA-binding protein YlxM (UPF0122 family)